MPDSQSQSPARTVSTAFVDDVAWRAVVDATQSTHEVLAELARDSDGSVAFIGRPLAGGDLVVLKLEPEPADETGTQRYSLFELKKLDDTVPAPRISCPVCAALVGAWRGRCPACGVTVGAGAEGPVGTDVLLAFYRFVSGRHDVIGELATEGAGPPAYLVRARDGTQYFVVRLTLGGTGGSGPKSYVVDVLPLVGAAGGVAGAPTRLALDLGGSTAAMVVPTPTSSAERTCPQCGARFGAGTLFCPLDGASLRPVTSGSDLVGQLIDDRYYIEQRLGEGGMGEVYVAHQVRTGRKCALKLMHRSMTQDPDAVGRFRREASSACAISHPHVATIFDSGETSDRRPYFAMEFVDGRSLSQVIRDEGRLDPWRATDIARQIALGLAAAHDLEIVHRDLKPDNVMLGAARGGSDYVKLVDFGIAKPTTTAAGNTITRTGFILGTPAYMSPEQLCADKLDGRSDLYSLGCVLFEMLTGEAPLGGSSLEKLMMHRLTEEPPHPRTLNDQIPPILNEIVVRLLARSVDDRYPDAHTTADVLGTAQDTLEGPRATTGVRTRGGPLGMRTPTPGPRPTPVGSVRVATGHRPPRRSHDNVPPAPLSPAIPFRTPALGVPRVSDATLARATAARRNRIPVAAGAAALVLVAGGAFAVWRLTRSTAAPVQTSVPASRDSVRTAPASAPSRDSQSVPAAIVEQAKPPARQSDTARATKPAPKTPAGATVTRPEPAASQAVTQAPATTVAPTTPAISTTTPLRDTKPLEVAPAAPPPVVTDAAKARGDAAETQRAEITRARESIESFVRAIGAKQLETLQQIFPSMNRQTRDGYDAFFRSVSDLSTQLIGTPDVSVHGTMAEAQFVSEMKYRDPSRGNVSQRTSYRAKLQRTDQGWIILSLGAVQ
jgi:serine/threonine-protein kinase